MKVRISISDLKRGKFCPDDEKDRTQLFNRTLSKDQVRSIAQFLYEVLERSKEE